jgi:putative membrane protein
MPRIQLSVATAIVLAAGSLAAAPSALGAVAPGVSGLDQEYLKTSIQGDRFEIEGGRLALAHSHNAAVRRLAATLVKDHTQSLATAAELARSLGVDIPKHPTPSQQWELGMVGRLSGRAFDRAYSSLEIKDHRQDIMETSSEVAEGLNHAVRHDANQELPTLRMHLALSLRALRRS